LPDEKPSIPAEYAPLLHAFAASAPGVALLDLDGRILGANNAFASIVGRAPEEIENVHILDLTHPDDRLRHQILLQKLVERHIPSFLIEKRCQRPDRREVWVRSSVSFLEPLPIPGEHSFLPDHLVAICENITDRKRAEEALEHQERMAVFGTLASSIVHEINNPLEAVLNLIYLAQQSATIEDARTYLRMAEGEIARASETTAQALQFHRDTPTPVTIDMVELLRSVFVLFKGKLTKAGVQVHFRPEDSPKLVGFPGELRQVFANLIGNAIDAMPHGGEIQVRVRPARDWRGDLDGVRITIADSGHGMSPETRRQIFQAFFTTKGASGSGLGLWVTANIVNKHGGGIHVRSRRVAGSSGTIFTLMFPSTGAQGKDAGMEGYAA
jgi:PAS domain S-box-containing protein